MLQARPTSPSGMLQASQAPTSPQYGQGTSQKRHSIHGLPGGSGAPLMYRGSTGSAQPYAVMPAPSLRQGASWQQFSSFRANSAPTVPTMQTVHYSRSAPARPRYTASASMTNLPATSVASSQHGSSSRDDLSLPISGVRRTGHRLSQSSQTSGTSSQSTQSSLASAAPLKASPERYRRTALRSNDSASSQSTGRGLAPASSMGPGAMGQNQNPRALVEQRSSMAQNMHVAFPHRPNSIIGSLAGSAVDDMQLPHGLPQGEMKRFRRRSMPALDSTGAPKLFTPHEVKQPEESTRLEQSARPKTADTELNLGKVRTNLSVHGNISSNHVRANSSDSRSSTRSGGSNSRSSSVSILSSEVHSSLCVCLSRRPTHMANVGLLQC